MPRLARLRFVSVVHPHARLDDLMLDLRDASGRATDSTLWLRNGGGKSSILNLFFALVRPDRREFLGGRAEAKKRRIEDYVLPDDHAVAAAEWELDGAPGQFDLGEGPARYLTGVFYEWRAGSMADETRLRRLFFATKVSPADARLTIDGLPLFITAPDGRRSRRTLASFRQEWTALRAAHPHLEVVATENQREWSEWLDAVGLDPELFAYQIRMNQREGGIDELFRFDEHEKFVDFLLELALDPGLGEKVSRNVATYRRELKERKDRLLPERELLDGLASQLVPLVQLAAERSALAGRTARAARSLEALAAHVDQRIAALFREAGEQGEVVARERAAAEEARARAASEARRAAALRHFAAERRHARAVEDLERARRAMEEAQRQMQLWEAAVPLHHALRFEREADRHRRELDRRRQEHAPVLADLRKAARALVAALRHHAGCLRREEADRRAEEATAREEARTSRSFAAESQAHAARAGAEVERLEGLLREGDEERARLEHQGILARGEDGAAGAARLDREIGELEVRQQALAERLDGLRQRQRSLQADKAGAAAEAAVAHARADEAQRRLEEGLEVRRALEADPVLRQHLEVEAVEVERLPDQAIARLHEAARRALDEVVRLEIERAEDDRAVVRLEETGLLPPTRDAERVIERLGSRLPAVWSGWSYIEANAPKDGDARRRLVERHPQLALGVIVRDADFDKARELLQAGGVLPETPVTVAPQSTMSAPAELVGLVLGPASEAFYDRAAGQDELLRRRARLDAARQRIGQEETRRADLEGLAGRLLEFRRRYPRGWFAEQEARTQAEQRGAEGHERRAQTCAAEIAAIDAEAGDLAREQVAITRALADRSRHLALVEQFVRRHEALRAERQAALDAARVRCAEETREQGRWLEEADQAEARAAQLSVAAHELGEEARVLEEEVGRIEYLDGAVEVAPGAIDELRDQYRQLKTFYEGKVGEEELLHFLREAEARAQEERRKLAARLSGPAVTVDEAAVHAALAGLDDPARVEARRQEAIEAYSSATGAYGSQTQAEARAKEKLSEARRACEARGAALELHEDEQPAGPIQADAEAEAAEEEAGRLEALAAQHADRVEQAERQRVECTYRAEGLGKDRKHLRTVTESYEDLVASAGGPAGAEPWTPPADDAGIAEQTSAIEQELKQLKAEAARLNAARQKAAKAVRSWASQPQFEPLQSRVARQFSMADEADLEARAEAWRKELALRIETIDAQLAEMNRHRDVLITEALAAAEEGLALLRSAATQSRLPDHLPGLGGAYFLRVTTHVPDVAGERRGRIGALVDELVDEGEIPTGVALVQQAVRRLAKPIRVRVLNPDPDVDREAVDITDMARFSGGEQLTGAILLYCTLAQLRARARGLYRKPSSVLVLDNPIGRASRVRFLELQREVARAMGVQLFYTTAVNDHDALGTLPSVIRVRNQRVDRNSGHRMVERATDGDLDVEAARIVRSEALAPQAANGQVRPGLS